MRFIVDRTSQRPIREGDYPMITFETILHKGDLPVKAWVLEIEDLFDLLKFRDATSSDLVLSRSSVQVGLPVISIYDGNLH